MPLREKISASNREQLKPIDDFERENFQKLAPFQQYIRSGGLVEREGKRRGHLKKDFVNTMAQHRFDTLVAEGWDEDDARAAAITGAKRFRKMYHTVNTLDELGGVGNGTPEDREQRLTNHYMAPLYKEAFIPEYAQDEKEATIQMMSKLKANEEYKARVRNQQYLQREGSIAELGEPEAVKLLTNPVAGGSSRVDESQWGNMYRERLKNNGEL